MAPKYISARILEEGAHIAKRGQRDDIYSIGHNFLLLEYFEKKKAFGS